MVLGKLPVPGRHTIWITVGQGPIALAVGAGGGSLDSSIFWMPDCQIQNSRTGNSRNTRTRNTRRPEQEIPNCQTCGSFLKEKKFRAYQKFFFISNTRAVLSRIPFICCIYQTSLAFLKYFTYLKIPYIPV